MYSFYKLMPKIKEKNVPWKIKAGFFDSPLPLEVSQSRSWATVPTVCPISQSIKLFPSKETHHSPNATDLLLVLGPQRTGRSICVS
jgi:hypothetical protein